MVLDAPMIRYALWRLLMAIPVMLVASSVIFVILRVLPGDPALMIAGERATEDEIAAIRESLGTDRPLPVQYIEWLGAALVGDLGQSTFSGQPVTRLIAQRLEPTLSLALPTLALSVLVSLALGTLAARRTGGLADKVVTAFSVLGFSVPPFVVGYALVAVFSLWLGWTPVQGYRPLSDGIAAWATALVLPVLTLSTGYVALITRVTRASMVEALSEDHVRTARAKNLGEGAILARHGLRVAAVPIVTVAGVGLALLLGGFVVTETVFNIPGVGRLVVEAIARRDYPVIQGVVLLSAGIYVMVNLLVDLSYTFLDPRIRY
jgi:peptide/nickel transport system permease protein